MDATGPTSSQGKSAEMFLPLPLTEVAVCRGIKQCSCTAHCFIDSLATKVALLPCNVCT